MTLERDIGTIPTSALEANVIRWQWFVKMQIAAPVGTKRFTDAEDDLTIDVDGSSQTWTATDLQVGNLDQGKQFFLNPSTISFGNLDTPPTWSTWANSPGLRNATVEVWAGWWTTAGVYSDAVKLYHGKVDNHRPGNRCEIALKPWHSLWARDCPTHIPGLSDLLPAALMPKYGETIYWNSDQKR
jgi:hypothetical protein